YRIKNETACTYEVDDTPPFPIDREALQIAIEIAQLSKLNIVGEVHITRKQYLDGSIPTGFQRTAIIGVEGSIPLKNKTIRLNPDEVKEACDYIRFLNRSTGKVRTGIGAGREDVNVSCKGGTRIEIKGVAHTRWIPELTHNEAFRQWSLLLLRDELKKIKKPESWKIESFVVVADDQAFSYEPLAISVERGETVMLVKLPGFKGALSHFTQPEKSFANEISDRLKVIACLEKPNMIHSESFVSDLDEAEWKRLAKQAGSKTDDALILIWGPQADMKTALETIEERCKMAFEGVPNETRKSLTDGTTIFERVLPGADRMYPDTDSAPIPLEDSYISELSRHLPTEVIDRYQQMQRWGIPQETYTYIFSKNYFPLIEEIVNDLAVDPKFLGTFFGHRLKNLLGKRKNSNFKVKTIYRLFAFLKENKLNEKLAVQMLPVLIDHPRMEFESVLSTLKFKKASHDELSGRLPFIHAKFTANVKKPGEHHRINWIMGQIRKAALGNVELAEIAAKVAELN
ncbi:MAG: Glu-tRNA(Gln) amidotransferase GatDE subunit E, partial [Deltaproteobacteria bacterium]|nr:Glu-tRNA(Gln) amidotransferase GatDE subunit E [Deltaproteobacteria bacterium]